MGREAAQFELQVNKAFNEEDFKDKETEIEGLIEVEHREIQAGEEKMDGEMQTEELVWEVETMAGVWVPPEIAVLPAQTVNLPVFFSADTVTLENLGSESLPQPSTLLKSPLFAPKPDEYIEEIELFEDDIQKILGPAVTSDQLEAIEESLYRRLSAVWQPRAEASVQRGTQDTSGIEPFALTPRETEEKQEQIQRRSRLRARTRGLSSQLASKRLRDSSAGKGESTGAALVRRYLVEGRRLGHTIPKKMLSRLISWAYSELLMRKKERETAASDSLATMLFDLFTHKYGFEKLSERKMKQVVNGCFAYKEDIKIETFARLLGLWDAYSVQSFRWFLKALDYTSKYQYCLDMDGEDTILLPLTRAIECGKALFEGQIKPQLLTDFKLHLESFKIHDPRGFTKSGLLNLDLFLQEILSLCQFEERKSTDFLRLLFIAASVSDI